jgi:hypothetical protein
MPYASVEDTTNPTTSPLTGLYQSPQSSPTPPGYIGPIAETDSRIATFQAAVAAEPG